MTDSFIFSGSGFVTGKYKITNDEIYQNVKKGLLGGFNEERIIASDSFIEAKSANNKLSPFDYMVYGKMGFKERYHVVPFPPSKPSYKRAENTLGLAVKSVELALEEAGISGKQIDAWFIGTATPDQFAPGIAEFTKAYFTDIEDVSPTFSLTSACVGFNINLEHAVSYFNAHPEAQHIVVAHAEIMSELLVNEHDFVPFSTFGDSAAAIIVSRVKTDNKCGILDITNGEDVAMLDFLGANIKGDLYMDARRVKSRAVPNIAGSMKNLLDNLNWQIKDVDWFIPHQTGNAIVHSVKELLAIPSDKLFQEIQYEYGNLSGASVPAAYDLLSKSNRIKPNQKLITAVAGLGGEFGGFAYVVPEMKYRFKQNKELEGSTILITGASGGIGSKIAEYAAAQGAELIIHYYSNKDKAIQIKEKIQSDYGVIVDLWKADLSVKQEVIEFVEGVKKKSQKIDYLINTHAITGSLSKASKVSDEEFIKVINSNYQSVRLLCDSLMNVVEKAILITGSVGEDAQFPGSVSYVAAKRALRGYAVNLAADLYDRRVGCIYYLPGLVDGGMISKLDNQQVIASMMSVDQHELVNRDDIAMRMLKSVYRLKIANVRISYESKLKVIKDGYLKF